MRKLRRVAKTAEALVEGRRQLLADRIERRGRERGRRIGRLRRQVAEDIHERVVLRAQLLALRVVVLRHALEDGGEGGHAVTRLVRKIRAAEEGLVIVVRQEHGQRPAAATLREHLVRKLVDLVEVGALFAIDLDVDEQPVHERRGLGGSRTTRAPSHGTSGRPNSQSTAGWVCRSRGPGPALPCPMDTNRRDSLRAAAGKGWFPLPTDSFGASWVCIGR